MKYSFFVMRCFLFLLLSIVISCGNGNKAIEKSVEFTRQSQILIRSRNYQEALVIVKKAIELDSKNYAAYNNLGYIKLELNYPKTEVYEAFKRSYELNENGLVVLISLTNFHCSQQNYKEAVKFGLKYLEKVDKSVENVSERAQMLSIIGESYNYLNSFDKAIIYLTESLQLDSNHAGSYKERGSAYRDIGEKTKALSDFNKAIEIDSLYHQAYNSRAICYERLNLNDRAILDYNRAISIESNSSIYYLNRAKLRIKLGNIKEACSDISKSYSLGNDEAKGYYLKYCTSK